MILQWEFLLAVGLLGMLAGVLAGLLGVGGGLLIVPALIVIFGWQGVDGSVIAHAAIGTSLASIIATSISSARAHHAHGAVNWQRVKQLSAGLFVGSLAGALFAGELETGMLQLVFGLFAISVSFQMWFRPKVVYQKTMPGRKGMNLAGMFIGAVSGIVGIGGGSMTVPFLTWHGVSIRQAVATSSACGLPIAMAGFAGFVISGWSSVMMPQYSWGYVHLPTLLIISLLSVLMAPLGARLAHKLPVVQLKRIFAVLLLVIGVKLTDVLNMPLNILLNLLASP